MACNVLHSVEYSQRNVGGCLHRHFVHASLIHVLLLWLCYMHLTFTVAYICLSDSYNRFLRTLCFRALLFFSFPVSSGELRSRLD